MPTKLKTFKVLALHEKHGVCYVSARTPEEEMRAYLSLFNLMDEMGYYNYDGALNVDEQVWYANAKAGDGKSAKWLIGSRSGYEYETVTVEWVTVPE
jgi:hypothetical protein